MKNQTLQRGIKVSVIPATKGNLEYTNTSPSQHALRVAAYCRVSTGDESQQSSYGKQKSFYTDLILDHPGWRLAGIYADEAISGTSRAHRDAFNQMMKDAVSGKIDYIITKSISRFARNTVDTLHCVRQLRQLTPPVGIFFEKENIDTLDAKGELILTILSALAQEESRSISENIRWAFQKNFRSGKPHVNLNRMLGYDWDEKGNWVINPQQAEQVQFIFQRFLAGDSGRSIAEKLNRMGKTTVQGNVWRSDGVYTVLRNEKYVGDLEMQKTVTVDFLNHRCAVNRGEAPRYYVKDHHPAIVSRLDWEKVQAMLNSFKERKEVGQRKRRSASVFSLLVCPNCGQPLRRMTYSLKDPMDGTQFRYPVWRCAAKKNNSSDRICIDCSHTYSEIALKQSFMELLYRCKLEYETFGDSAPWIIRYRKERQIWKQQRKNELYGTPEYQKQRAQLAELEQSFKDTMQLQLSAPFDSKELCFETEEQELYGQLIERMQQEIKNVKRGMEEYLECHLNTAEKEKQFSFFLSCLSQLPSIKLCKINSNDDESVSTSSECPLTLFLFQPGIFSSFVTKGIVDGEVVHYEMNFGTTLSTTGNLRQPRQFLCYHLSDGSGCFKPVTCYQNLK